MWPRCHAALEESEYEGRFCATLPLSVALLDIGSRRARRVKLTRRQKGLSTKSFAGLIMNNVTHSWVWISVGFASIKCCLSDRKM